MTDVSTVSDPDAKALREWAWHQEQVMRGVAHALNNRAAALSAIIELSREPDDDQDETRSMLEGELKRQRELANAIRVLGPVTGEPEPLLPNEVVPDVLALLRLHAAQRERLVEIESGASPVVRVRRALLQRALLVLCATAPTSDPARRVLRAALTEEGDWFCARVTPPPDGGGASSAYVADLARQMGGEPLDDGFRIPTLDALRRREGR